MILEGYGREPDSWHPTQKNVALVAYLIRTYTNVGGESLIVAWEAVQQLSLQSGLIVIS